MDEIRILLMDVGIPAYFADIGFWVTLLGVICDGVVLRTYLASCG